MTTTPLQSWLNQAIALILNILLKKKKNTSGTKIQENICTHPAPPG